jgi:uncharacterized protein (TIGR04222 family)
MALAAATADTWGISGPEFLMAYVIIAVAVLVIGTRARKQLADPVAPSPAVDLSARPHDVAYLNGGNELAVYSALSAMHLRGTITSAGGTIRAAGRLDPDTDGLERAIHFTAGSPVQRKRLQFHRPVQTALTTIHERLVSAGLLLSDAQRRRIRHVGYWMLAVAGLGFVRLLAGIAEARPVGYLLAMLVAVTIVALVQLARAPRRTSLGNRTLADLKTAHHGLAPTQRPDWHVYGPAGAALSVGVFGTSALWASDPAFAHEIEAQRVSSGGSSVAATGGDGGGSGDGGGGGGGCGGGGCGG